MNILLVAILSSAFILAQFPNSVSALSINITVNSGTVIGTNSFSLGFQLDGATISMWQSRSVLRELAQASNLGLVRLWSNAIEPCTRWYESTKTGTWNWKNVDALLKGIFAINAQPLIVLGFYSWTLGRIKTPQGMTDNPQTGLPYPDSWGAYCAQWVKHFKEVGLPVRYYEIINEPHHYWKMDGWPTAQPKLSYFMQLYNAAAKAMRSQNSNVLLGNDNSIMKGVLDYFISNGENLNFLSYHGYATGSLSTSDAEILAAAETKYIGESSAYYGVDKAKQLYKTKKGIDLPVIESEDNINYCYSTGTDPRTQKMLGAVYDALTFRNFMLKGYAYHIYFHYASSASKEQAKSTGGAGYGMVNTDTNKPWYPYYAHKMLGQNLAVGDKIVESTSSSDDVRVVSWIHGDILNVMLINKVDAARTISLQGLQGRLNFSRIDNSISWKTPSMQLGTIDAGGDIAFNGYTVMLLQGKPGSSQSVNEDGFESNSFAKWTGVLASSGEAAITINWRAHHGKYSARFSSNAGGATEYAYTYKTISETDVYVRGYFYFAAGLPLTDNGDRFYVLRLMAGSQSLASVGVRRNNGVDKWVLNARSGSGSAGPVYATSPTVAMGRWYCVELHWKQDTAQGLIEMYVDGVKILQITGLNTAYFGKSDRLDFGLVEAANVQKSLVVYGDCFVLSRAYVNPEP